MPYTHLLSTHHGTGREAQRGTPVLAHDCTGTVAAARMPTARAQAAALIQADSGAAAGETPNARASSRSVRIPWRTRPHTTTGARCHDSKDGGGVERPCACGSRWIQDACALPGWRFQGHHSVRSACRGSDHRSWVGSDRGDARQRCRGDWPGRIPDLGRASGERGPSGQLKRFAVAVGDRLFRRSRTSSCTRGRTGSFPVIERCARTGPERVAYSTQADARSSASRIKVCLPIPAWPRSLSP